MKKRRMDEIIRVDHAGEHGAIAIYKGQLSALSLIGDLIDLLKNEKQDQLL